MLNSATKAIPLATPPASSAIDELLTTLNCLEALQSLERQRLRLLIDRSVEDSSSAVTATRQPDIAFRLPRAA